MKTFLVVWYNSSGTRTSEVNDRLMSMGFRPMHGIYDYIYDWDKNATVEDAIALGDQVHATLQGCNVRYKLNTE